jgi:hypothetical protein
MKRRLCISLLSGAGLNVVFLALSMVVRHFFSYRDKPQMPNPFDWFLMPGLIVVSTDPFYRHQMLALATALTINTLFYSLIVFWLLSLLEGVDERPREQGVNRDGATK